MIAYIEFDHLKQIVSETALFSYGSKTILQPMKNEELKIQLAISAGLTCQIRELWSHLTKTTTRRRLSESIVALKARLDCLKNDELNIIQLITSISVDDEDAVRKRELFPETPRNNPDILSRIKEIYLNIVDQMMPLLESFEDVYNESSDEKVVQLMFYMIWSSAS